MFIVRDIQHPVFAEYTEVNTFGLILHRTPTDAGANLIIDTVDDGRHVIVAQQYCTAYDYCGQMKKVSKNVFNRRKQLNDMLKTSKQKNTTPYGVSCGSAKNTTNGKVLISHRRCRVSSTVHQRFRCRLAYFLHSCCNIIACTSRLVPAHTEEADDDTASMAAPMRSIPVLVHSHVGEASSVTSEEGTYSIKLTRF